MSEPPLMANVFIMRSMQPQTNLMNLTMVIGNLIYHSSMNWAQFKDSLCYPCLAGTLIESWSLTQGVACSNSSENIYGKRNCSSKYEIKQTES